MASTTTTGVSTNAPGEMTGKPLIESDRVEGTAVYDPTENHIGSIKRLMIDKMTGQVAYTVMSFGGFMGIGEDEHTIPWNKLHYDSNLGGFRTDITEDQLRGAPTFIATAIMTGQIGSASASCTTIGARRIIGGRECGRT